MKKFIMMIGASGSGKSTFAKNWAKQLDGVWLSSDAIRAELWGDENDQQHPETVFRIMNKRLMDALDKDFNVIYDATNLSAKRRRALVSQIRAHYKEVFCEAVVVVADLDLCVIRRSNPDDRMVPKDVIYRQAASFQCPWFDEGWDNIRVELGSPWWHNMMKLSDLRTTAMSMPHDNPHHLDTIGEHCHAVQDFIDQRADNQLVKELGELHDIGKVLTKKVGTDGIAHYFNHDNMSAYLSMYRCVGDNIKDFNFIHQAVVIGYHMRDYHWRGNEIGFATWLHSLDSDLIFMLTLLMQADRACSID